MSNSLRHYRREKEMSQLELAKQVGVTRLTISNIETGKTKDPATSITLGISEILGHSVDAIFGSENVNLDKHIPVQR
jgi:putative transcriptional regulator